MKLYTEPNDVELLAKVPIGRFFLALGISTLLCLIIPLTVLILFNLPITFCSYVQC